MIAYKGFDEGLVCRGYQFTMGENVVVRVVYTSGINYIWGALMIGVLMLVAKVIAKHFGKN